VQLEPTPLKHHLDSTLKVESSPPKPTYKVNLEHFKGAVPFHFKVPICDLWENGKIYDIDSCRDYIWSKTLIMVEKRVHSEVIN
jgi:hypothetical protein